MEGVGFKDVKIINVPKTFHIENPKEYWMAMLEGFPGLQEVFQQHFQPEEKEKVCSTFEKLLLEHFQGKPIMLTGEATFGVGTK